MTSNSVLKVVVTGGAGFLGSHLVPALIEEGFEVHVIDNLVSGKKEHVPKKAKLHLVDIREQDKLQKLFKKIGNVSYVFHLAALPRVQFSIDNPFLSHDVNINGTLSVLLTAKNAGVKRVIYSASSSAYGDQKTLPIHEGLASNPMSPYALQKYTGEHYCRVFNLVYGLSTVALRYFNIYGPNADPNGPYAQAIIKFIYLRSQGKPLTITGDGTQTRDSVHVRDVVRANILAMKSEKVGKGEVINIGSGKNCSINDIAKMIGGSITYLPPRIEPKNTRADISRAKELLGWTPSVSLEDGIAELKKIYGL